MNFLRVGRPRSQSLLDKARTLLDTQGMSQEQLEATHFTGTPTHPDPRGASTRAPPALVARVVATRATLKRPLDSFAMNNAMNEDFNDMEDSMSCDDDDNAHDAHDGDHGNNEAEVPDERHSGTTQVKNPPVMFVDDSPMDFDFGDNNDHGDDLSDVDSFRVPSLLDLYFRPDSIFIPQGGFTSSSGSSSMAAAPAVVPCMDTATTASVAPSPSSSLVTPSVSTMYARPNYVPSNMSSFFTHRAPPAPFPSPNMKGSQSLTFDHTLATPATLAVPSFTRSHGTKPRSISLSSAQSHYSQSASLKSKPTSEFVPPPTSKFSDVLVCVTGCEPEDRDKIVVELKEKFDSSSVIKACGDGSVYYIFFRGAHTEQQTLFIKRVLGDGVPATGTMTGKTPKCDFVVFSFTSENCGFQPPAALAHFQELASAHPDRALVTRMCPLEEVGDLLCSELHPQEPCEMLTRDPTLEQLSSATEPRLKRKHFPKTKAMFKTLKVSVREFFSPSDSGIRKAKSREKIPSNMRQHAAAVSDQA